MRVHHSLLSPENPASIRYWILPLLLPILLATAWVPGGFDRSEIKSRLADKQRQGQPWVAHVLVPLCDNEHQGIVPVNSSLGNGQSLRTNLYWGAGYGIRTHFQRRSDWKSMEVQQPSAGPILERVAFHKQYPGGPEVILVADAYDGSRMQACLTDYFNYLAGKDSLCLPGFPVPLGSGADLIAFNGHNGLMDEEVRIPANRDRIHRDAVAIACISHSYFEESLAKTGGYPFLTTNHLLAPEAYAIRGVIDAWAAGKEGEEVRKAAGAAYHAVQKCGLRGATNLFHAGW